MQVQLPALEQCLLGLCQVARLAVVQAVLPSLLAGSEQLLQGPAELQARLRQLP